MWKKFGLPLSVVVIGLGVLAAVVFAKPKPVPNINDEPPALIKVAVIKAEPSSLRLTVDAQGTVEPKREIDLTAQVSGLVVSVDAVFNSGGFFDKDQALLSIDGRDYEAALLSAKARLAEAERRLAEERGLARQAQREWRDLGNQNANDLFIRRPQLAAASASLAFAKADVESAALNLERASITVPFNGRIKEAAVNIGQFVNQGTRVATVYDSAVAEIRLPLTEAQASLINLPFTANAKNKPNVKIHGVVAGRQGTWAGVLTRTDAFVDPRTRMYYAVVEVVTPFAGDVPLLPGLFVDTKIDGKPLNDVLVLPRAALFKRNKVMVINDDNKTQELTARVLRKTADTAWLQVEGINKGAKISLEKQILTPDGTEVEAVLTETNQVDEPVTSAASLSAQ